MFKCRLNMTIKNVLVISYTLLDEPSVDKLCYRSSSGESLALSFSMHCLILFIFDVCVLVLTCCAVSCCSYTNCIVRKEMVLKWGITALYHTVWTEKVFCRMLVKSEHWLCKYRPCTHTYKHSPGKEQVELVAGRKTAPFSEYLSLQPWV